MKAPPVVLTIAGSDNSCGAGAQADLKTITALGGYGQTAITCVVAEVPGCVESIQPIKPEIVAAQIRLSCEAFPVAAIKTGMLFSTEIVRAVHAEIAAQKRKPWLVIDPVMVASSGDPLLKKSAIRAYEDLLFPLADLVTPNLDELRILSGLPCRDVEEMKTAGAALVKRHRCAFLLKGGHLGGREAVDILATKAGFTTFAAPFVRASETHGTGCSLSAAIATALAKGSTLEDAVGTGKVFITEAIRNARRWPKAAALDHVRAGRAVFAT